MFPQEKTEQPWPSFKCISVDSSICAFTYEITYQQTTKIKRHVLLGRKVMTNLDSIFKNKDVSLPTKDRLVKAGISLEGMMLKLKL